ncbi:MAG: hypothetical protein KAK01_00775 [Candidatus Marinimicrobia bacterium]|nr:hypothetical protein [Candidatus Neomarinimicrobiota bacterium]
MTNRGFLFVGQLVFTFLYTLETDVLLACSDAVHPCAIIVLQVTYQVFISDDNPEAYEAIGRMFESRRSNHTEVSFLLSIIVR